MKFTFGRFLVRNLILTMALLALSFVIACGNSSSSSNSGGLTGGGSSGSGSTQFLYALTAASPGTNSALSGFAIDSSGILTTVGAATSFPTPFNSGSPQAAPILGGRFILATSGDLIVTYKVNADGSLTQTSTAPAPDLGFQILPEPSSHFVYANRSAGNSGAIQTYSIDQNTGALTALGTPAPMPLGLLIMDPLGRFLFVTNIGQVQAFHIDTTTGALTPAAITTGLNTDITIIAPNGRFFYAGPASPHGNSFQLTGFTIDPTTGALTVNGQQITFSNVRWAFDPASRFLFVNDINGIRALTIDTTNGLLTDVTGSPFSRGSLGSTSTNGFVQLTVDLSGNFLYVTDGAQIGTFAIASNGALSALGNPTPLTGASSTAVQLFTVRPSNP